MPTREVLTISLEATALLPEQEVLMPFDLVFSPNEHAFTVVDHFDHWMIVLESLKALERYETITIGHDTPVHRSAIDSTITYFKRAKEINEASADAKTYSESLKAAFPDRQEAGWVDFSAGLSTPRPVPSPSEPAPDFLMTAGPGRCRAGCLR